MKPLNGVRSLLEGGIIMIHWELSFQTKYRNVGLNRGDMMTEPKSIYHADRLIKILEGTLLRVRMAKSMINKGDLPDVKNVQWVMDDDMARIEKVYRLFIKELTEV
jgi:hypothetical protein